MASKKCGKCDKTVYAMELQDYDNIAYHKTCFKCLKCAKNMSVGSVAKISGDLYCKPCFKAIFKEKGSYASFGEKTLAKNAPIKDLIASGKMSSGGEGVPSEESKDGMPAAAAVEKDLGSLNLAVNVAVSKKDSSEAVSSPSASSTSPAAAAGTHRRGMSAAFQAGAPASSASGAPQCGKCSKSVYPMERQDYDSIAYHKVCFKCLKCTKTMSIGSVAKIVGDLYCKPCFKAIFKEKGSYASFGEKTLAKNAPIKDLIASGRGVSNESLDDAALEAAAEAAAEAASVESTPSEEKAAVQQELSEDPSNLQQASEDVAPTYSPAVQQVLDASLGRLETLKQQLASLEFNSIKLPAETSDEEAASIKASMDEKHFEFNVYVANVIDDIELLKTLNDLDAWNAQRTDPGVSP